MAEKSKKPKILVTGGAGFIGSNFCNINKDKYDIVALDSLFLGDPDNLCDLNKIRFIKGDACKLNDLKKCGKNFDYVVHLAGTSSAPMFYDDGFVNGYVNSVKSFVQTLDFARKTGAKKFLYASSSSLYGNNPVPLVEHQRITPPNHYSVTKYLYEHCSNVYHKNHPQMQIIGFRFMSVYGQNEEAKGPYANVISQFIWDIIRKKSPIIYGDGAQYRDFTNVKDVIQGIALAMKSEKNLGSDVFNIGTGEFTSLNDIIRLINEEIKKQGKIYVDPIYVDNPIKETYIQSQCADITKIKSVLGFKPNVKLQDGISWQISNVKLNKIRKTSSDILKEKMRMA